ncbi:MAG: DNA topoisomerase [Blautia obeum]
MIEKLIEKGFIERKKKQILPTADGRNLIRILPEMIKSPKLTAEWENDLTLISKGRKMQKSFFRN